MFSYPYARSRETLTTLSRNGDPDSHHGYKLRYIDPTTGGSPMPTIGAFMALLPGGFNTAPYRSTDGTIYSVVEGTGETIVGDTVLRWKPRDISWFPVGTPITIAPHPKRCCSASRNDRFRMY